MNEDRLRIWAARLAAPVAFFFAAIVLVALVQRALSADDADPDGTPPAAASTPAETEPGTTTEPEFGETVFQIQGAEVSRDSALVGLGVGVALGEGIDLTIGYDGQFGMDDTAHGLEAVLKIGL